MPRLFILSGPDLGKSVDVDDGALLGRADDCSVHLRDPSVSRKHARLQRSGGRWSLVDTESRNGVYLADERVPLIALEDGLEFRVGEVHLRFRLDPPKPEMEEITLEEYPLDRTRISAPPPTIPEPVAARPAPAAARPAAARPGIPRPGTTEVRGQRILQYNKIADRDGFFASDLAQHPLWIKVGAALLALVVFAAIFLFAFKGTALLKSHASGGASAAPEDGN
jgi:hypothetical protein